MGCRLVGEEKVPHEMYQITWRPGKPGQFPDRPASPTSAAVRFPRAALPSRVAPRRAAAWRRVTGDGAAPRRGAVTLVLVPTCAPAAFSHMRAGRCLGLGRN